MKLLLVEDNPLDARLLREILKDTPPGAFQIEHAGRLDAALECLRQQPIDLVLLDLGLPDSQGAESLGRVRHDYPALPVIVLTGLENPDVALEAMRAGAQDYLVKGRFDADLLTRVIRYSVERKRVSEELRQINAELERRVEERTAELRASEDRMRLQTAAIESAANAIAIVDRNGAIQWVNAAFARLTGFSTDEAIGNNPRILKSGKHSPELYARLWKTIMAGRVWHGELVNRRKDGSHYTEEMTVTPVTDGAGSITHFIAIKQDVTVRRQQEEDLRRLNRSLSALGKCDRLHMRSTEELAFVREVCQIIVQDCGHPMVWVGYAENDPAKSVRIVAHAGFEAGYLETLRLTWADEPRGRGPTGTAIRTGTSQGCNNMLTDPAFAPWRDEALQRGYASSLALPLRTDGTTFGALTIYSRQPDVFSAAEEELLGKLADDLAFGITALRLRTANKQSEEALRVSEHRYRLLVEQTVDGIYVSDPNGNYIDVNPAGAAMLGYSPEEICRLNIADVIAGNEVLRIGPEVAKFVDGAVVRSEWRFRRKDGTCFDGEVMGRQLPDGRLQAVLRDITERKQAEDQIRILNRELEQRVLDRTAQLNATVTALESEIIRRRNLEREILEISEREQSRLGQDLHDGIGQELAGTAMLAEALTKQLRNEAHPMAAAADKIVTYIRSSIESTRRLAKGLYPIELARYGLLIALKDLANQTCERSGIRCELHQDGELPELAPSAEIHIYRIMQECVGNAIKHGKPHNILIESLAGNGGHTFAVLDDGVGFSEVGADDTGMGLHLMHYRARLIGAQITMEHPPAGGCRVTCRLPL